MPTNEWLISFAGGLCYAAATAMVVLAFHKGQPGAVSAIQYSQLVWGMLLAWLIWQEVPSIFAAIGGVLVVVAGLGILREQMGKVNV
ncbi:EamA family transporter [Veronia nyctiphanis]|uniref:EamA family transporter n=1 Tax=Veronia nyctiphanis TaxID=1278244 RepID=UPI0038B60E90